MKKIYTAFLTMASVSVLSACAGGKAQPVGQAPAPMPAEQTAPLTTSALLAADQQANVYTRLSRLEADVAGMKNQMGQIGPILEKMPALQDKLGELVTELQRIDARVAAAQEHVEALPPATAPVTTTRTVTAKPEPASMAPMRASPPEPMVKPAPAKGLVTTSAAPTPAEKPSTPKIIPEKAPAKTAEPVTPTAKPEAAAAKVETPKMAPAPAAAMTAPAPTPAPVTTTVTTSVSTTAAPAPMPTPAVAEPTMTTATPLQAAKIEQVRVGDYPDKTRLVLDVSRKVPFTTDLDNAEKILIIDLDAPDFAAPAGASFATSPLVASYTAQAVAGGKSRLIVQLREPIVVARTQSLPPNGEKGERIVLDLTKANP